MKILQVGKFYPIRGGVEKVMYELMLGLSAQGIHCDMLCAATEGHPAATIQLNSFASIFVVPTSVKLASTMLAPSMITKLRGCARDYDIIHIHHPDPMACLALFLAGYKGKVVLHWHSDILKQKTLLKLYTPLQNWLIKRADLIVGTTPVYVQESPFLSMVQEKIDYIPIGVEPILADRGKVESLRRRYADRKLVFSLGRLVEYKGYEYLIRAAAKLDDSYRIVIGGMGPLREALEALIVQEGLGEKVELIGFISDEELAAYFQACDLFCLSSIWKTEAFAIVQIEAMSAGKPVVSTAIPGSGVSWVNAHGVSGLVAPPADAEGLASAIQQVFMEPEQYLRLAEGSRKRYNEFFTRKIMVDKCMHLYANVLSGEQAYSMVRINTRTVPNAPYFEQVMAMLNLAKIVKIPVAGRSMLPFLRKGDVVALSREGCADVGRGKIVLAYYNNRYVLHRVLRAAGEFVELIGNNNLVQVERVSKYEVIAVVQEAYRNNRPLHINTKGQVLKAWLWHQMMPLRYLYGKFFIGDLK